MPASLNEFTGRVHGMNSLRWLYLTLVVSLLCFAVFALLPVPLEGWRNLTLNLGTEVFGILVTVVMIDSFIERFAKRMTLFANRADSGQLSAVSVSWPMADG